MIKKVALVSLSSGTIGEDFVRHEVALGLKRLKEFGLEVCVMPHAMKGRAYVASHPEKRAEDFLSAMEDPSIDLVLSAIGGDDTYRMLPYLFGKGELAKRAKNKPFLGFSDSTVNHLMLHQVGIPSFYGQAFLTDLCELDKEMLPYSQSYFQELLKTGTIQEIRPSEVWYEGRTDYSLEAVGTAPVSHPDSGFRLLQGRPTFSGKILGGCIDTLFDLFDNTRYSDSVALCETYGLFPTLAEWKGRILLLETSEEQPTPTHYRAQLEALKKTGIFTVISGILLGKPMDGKYQEAYEDIIREVVGDKDLPILGNLNVGHAYPHCIIPFGVEATVDAKAQVIRFHQEKNDE